MRRAPNLSNCSRQPTVEYVEKQPSLKGDFLAFFGDIGETIQRLGLLQAPLVAIEASTSALRGSGHGAH
jgi:hypothetical protein